MDDTTPMAAEHRDGIEPAPACDRCGTPKELVMLERFTGWWCRECASCATRDVNPVTDRS